MILSPISTVFAWILTFVAEPNTCKFPEIYKSPPNIVSPLTVMSELIIVDPDTVNVVPSYVKPLSPWINPLVPVAVNT